MRFGPPLPPGAEKYKEPLPKNLKEIPSYLKKTVGGTFSRLFYIFRLVWETQPLMFVFRLFMTVYDGVMPLVGTLITANLLEEVVKSFTGESDLIRALVFQFAYLFVQTLTSALSNMITRISGESITADIKVKIMQKAKSVDLKSFDMPDFYERLENANREAGVRPISILNATFELVSKFISMISYFSVLGAILKRLPKISILFFVLFVLLSFTGAAVTFYYKRQNFRYMFHRSKDRRQMNYYSEMMVDKDMVKEVRLFDLSDLFIGRYREIFKGYFKGMKRLIHRENTWSIVLSLLTSLMNAVLFYMIATNVTQIADYSLYTGALNAIATALATLITTVASIYEGSLFIDNMILFMKEEQTVRPTLETPRIPQQGKAHTIEFKDVTFRYPGAAVNVIDHMNLTLNAGETVALVGLNGAGKTTLIKLLTRLYDPTDGVIELDGYDIREYDLKALYGLFGIIFQDFGKYAETAEDNIAFSRISRKNREENAITAAKQSGSHPYIEKMPLKYKTPLTRRFYEDGQELSVGQWQKLSVARAFYSDADILILDEPTASLDALAEQEIYDRFDELRKGKMGIFVSHRLSSATTADRVIVLSGGKIVESGTHSQLMADRKEYYKLFSTQASHYVSPGENPPPPPPMPPHIPPKGGMPFPGKFPPPFGER